MLLGEGTNECTGDKVAKAINSTDDNGGGGGGSGGSVNTIVEEESNENVILPSHENLMSFVRLAGTSPSAHMSSTLLPMQGKMKRLFKHGVDKKRMWSLFNRKRKKLI